MLFDQFKIIFDEYAIMSLTGKTVIMGYANPLNPDTHMV